MRTFLTVVSDLMEMAVAYPNDFSLRELESLSSFKARMAYVRSKLERVGKGSSRIVFLTSDSGVILKVAMNAKGIAQNYAEADMSRYYDIVAEVVDSSNDDIWLEMERATKVSEEGFKQIAGVHLEDLVDLVRWRIKGVKIPKNSPDLAKWAKAQYNQDGSLLGDLEDIAVSFDLSVNDLDRIEHWGIVHREGKPKLVLIDYGATNQVITNYYMKVSRR